MCREVGKTLWPLGKLDICLVNHNYATRFEQSKHISLGDEIAGGVIWRAEYNQLRGGCESSQYSVNIDLVAGSAWYFQYGGTAKVGNGCVERECGRAADDVITYREKYMPKQVDQFITAMT